jgi:hypothetical protein
MRRVLSGVGIGIAVGALAAWLGLRGPDRAVRASTHSPASPPGGEVVEPRAAGVRLDAATRERLGLKMAALTTLEMPSELRGFGRVLDPSALVTPVHEREAAHATFEATEREYERVKTLERDSANASARELEAARAALARDRATLESAEARLVSVWGGARVTATDLPRLARALVSREMSVARIDLPLAEALPESPIAGRVAALADGARGSIPTRILGPAPNADPATQGRGFLLLIERAPWPSGTNLVGWLALPGPTQAGVDVPGSALVRQEGRAFAYVQTGPDSFARRVLELEHPTPGGWFVSIGLSAGEPVVVTGAQQLLSAELAGSVGEE